MWTILCKVKDMIYVQDNYGICFVNRHAFNRGNIPSILTAINKNSYFINRSDKIHKGKYDYSLVKYVNTRTKISIICPKHGVFNINANKHLRGRGCNKCANEKKIKPVEKLLEDFKKVHGDRYDYSLVNYINAKIKISVVCKEHGAFKIKTSAHLAGKGCFDCGEFKRWLRGRNPNSPAIFYSVKFTTDTESFYKVGVTVVSIKRRLHKSQVPYTYKIIQEINTTMYIAFHLELLIKKKLVDYNYQPLIKFGGSKTECFKI